MTMPLPPLVIRVLQDDWRFAQGPAMAEDGACVARCQLLEQAQTHDGQPLSPWVQCGRLAALAPDGEEYLCQSHRELLWTCSACGADLPQGDGRLCGSCQAHEILNKERSEL